MITQRRITTPMHTDRQKLIGYDNTPDTFRNVSVRLTAYVLTGLEHFIQVSLLPDLNKMMPKHGDLCHTVIPITKNCLEYCYDAEVVCGG
jgi:uncharacterized membrane protein